MITAKKHENGAGIEVHVSGKASDTIDEAAAIILSFVSQRKESISPLKMLEETIAALYNMCKINLNAKQITISGEEN